MIIIAADIKEELLIPLIVSPPEVPLLIYSTGGDFGVARAACDILELIPRDTIAVSQCHSSALLIFAAGRQRFATPTTQFIHHAGGTGIPDTANIDEASMLAEVEEGWEEWANSHLAACSSRTARWWTARAANGGTCLGCSAARGAGLVDQVLTKKILKPKHRLFKAIQAAREAASGKADGAD